MIFSFFSFAFNQFIIAYQAFRRTVSPYVLGFAGSNDHQAVSKFIVDHFAQYNIHAVQFIGMVAKVTFAAEASKQQLLSHQAININGILCAVRGMIPMLKMYWCTITRWRVMKSLFVGNWGLMG